MAQGSSAAVAAALYLAMMLRNKDIRGEGISGFESSEEKCNRFLLFHSSPKVSQKCIENYVH